MKRILWLSHFLPFPPKGGNLQRSFNLIKEVSQYHDIHLLAFNQKALLPDADKQHHAADELRKICRSVETLPIPSEQWKYGRLYLYFKSIFTPTPFTGNWLKSTSMDQAIKKTVEKYAIDLVHFDTISLAPFLSSAGQLTKVLNHHNVESAMMMRRARNESNIVKRLYIYQEARKLRRYENEVCRKFDLHITCSAIESGRLWAHCPELPIQEIPNGVNTEYFHPCDQEKEKDSLIFAGALNWYPNKQAMSFFAAKVWSILKQSIPNISMTVIGTDPPAKLVRLAARDQNFRVTGYVDDVRPYIWKAMAYVCPIRDGGGTRLKILDALAMGMPIVADPIACEGIDVKDGDTVMFATEPHEYIDRIKLLMSNSVLRNALSANGRKLVEEKYSWGDLGRRLSYLYEMRLSD